ncbi:MAG: F0F1 ATP synthase subunit B [Devosia sp.]
MAETIIFHVAQAEAPADPADAVQHGVVVEGETTGEHATTGAEHEGPIVFPPFDVTTFASQLLWFAIAFAALYLLMSRVALPQIGSILDKRRARIEGDLAEAERLKGETDKAIAAYEEALKAARANANAIAEETRAGIKADIDNKRADVEADLTRKVGDAEARIQANKTEALGRVGQIAAETAAAVLRQLSGEAIAGEIDAAVAEVVKG